MKTIAIFITALALGISNMAFGENQKGKIEINKEKKEGTVNFSKDGTWKGGASDLPRKPDASMSEKDRREQQQDTGGQIFIRKTF